MKRKLLSLPDCSSTSRFGKPINYPEALELQKKNDYNNFAVIIIPPFRDFESYLCIFPACSIVMQNDSESVIRQHENFIFYKQGWYSPKQIFSGIKFDFDARVFATYCCTKLGAKQWYCIPYAYFEFTTANQADFKKGAIQPVREVFRQFKCLSRETRGCGAKIREKIRTIVCKTFQGSRKKRPVPIDSIQEAVRVALERDCLDSARSFDSVREYDKFLPSNSTIYRILKRNHLI
jgi:hypothetical protein